jgi:hypothetical protein
MCLWYPILAAADRDRRSYDGIRLMSLRPR